MEIGLVVIAFFIIFANDIFGAIRDFNKQKHIEKVISELPEAERVAFILDYLKKQSQES